MSCDTLKTSDGVPLVPDMEVWKWWADGRIESGIVISTTIAGAMVKLANTTMWFSHISLYASREHAADPYWKTRGATATPPAPVE